MTFLPRTTLGKWSVVLLIAMPLLLILTAPLANSMYKSVEAGNGLVDDLAKRPLLAVAGLTGMCAGIASFVTGLLAIFKAKERAFAVYFATFIATLFVLFILGELAFSNE